METAKDKKKREKTSFKDLSDALTKVDYNQHVLSGR
jgi:hypothetical protein